jgi:hypothetical protein
MARSSDPIDQCFASRILETMKFLTARPLWISIESRVKPGEWRVEFSPRAGHPAATRLHPPISRGTHGFFEHGWKMFAWYLEFLIGNTPHKYWHRVTYYLHNAAEASAGSIDTWALGVSVAVEGLSGFIPRAISKEDKLRLMELRTWLVGVVEGEAKFASYADRVHGLTSRMFSSSVPDRLYPLSAQGRVTVEYIKDWKDFRHKQAHPDLRDLQNITSSDYQAMFDPINKATALMYQLVFHLIGYEGPYTDHGARGYPTRHYPEARPTGTSFDPQKH